VSTVYLPNSGPDQEQEKVKELVTGKPPYSFWPEPIMIQIKRKPCPVQNGNSPNLTSDKAHNG
jgi:hypothetical protein